MIGIVSLIIVTVVIIYFFKKRNSNKYFYLKGKSKTYEIRNLDRGIIGVGGAGSGKTFSLINPLLAHLIEERGVFNSCDAVANKFVLAVSLTWN